jgi:peptidase S41-like protein
MAATRSASATSAARKRRAKASPRPRAERTVEVQFAETVKQNLGEVQTLTDFRSTAGELSVSQRLRIVEQALLMIDQTYVHLPLKRAMHAIDPVQRLRLVRQRLDTYSERAFHNEMISIFVHLRDLHTNYVLPEPYSSRSAFLPFHIEECFEPRRRGGKPERQYVVTEVVSGLSDRSFKPGVVVTHWNGVPIDTAVEANAEREAGSNLDARHLQGLQSMTVRWMAMSLPPDEDWVVVRYQPNNGAGAAREARFEWQVIIPPPDEESGGTVLSAGRASRHPRLRRRGIDAKGEMQRRMRKLLFAPEAVAAQRKMAALGANASTVAQAFYAQVKAAGAVRAGSLAPELGATRRGSTQTGAKAARAAAKAARAAAAAASSSARGTRLSAAAEASALAAAAMLGDVDLTGNSIMPDVIKRFGAVRHPKGPFGYIRIVTFDISDGRIEEFVREFVRIAALLPQDGLIVDVRGNGGGYVEAGEALLQTMTPRPIEPEPFHVINTPLILQMCGHDSDLKPWEGSVRNAVETGATFSQGFPLSDRGFCNEIGQTYQGPVVLVIDAGCYSTTDIFAAGFQDHKIGTVLGTSGHTGAGGANVWEHTDLQRALPRKSSPFRRIPGGASFRVAIRRSTRVGTRSGEPLEDLGVAPDEPLYQMTRNDILNGNEDLIAHACGILADMQRQRLIATCAKLPDRTLDVTVTTRNVQRVDVLLDGRPVHTSDVKDGTTAFKVVPSRAGGARAARMLECRGFRGGELVASTRTPV